MASPESPKKPRVEIKESGNVASEPREPKVDLSEEAYAGTTEETMACLSSVNQGFFGKMSEAGKKIANQAYEGLYKIPVVNRVVGKMEIAYNQFWVDRHEKKAVKFKGKMDVLDIQMGVLDQSKKEIGSVITNLKLEHTPGADSLQLRLKEMDQKKIKLLNKKDKIQSKFESRENKAKLYTNERDKIADRFIGRYNEKLAPMEKELDRLQTCKDEVDLSVDVMEARHHQFLAKLEGTERQKTEIEEALRRAGMSEGKIRKSVDIKTLEEVLA